MKSLQIGLLAIILMIPSTSHCQWTVWCTNCSEMFTQALDRITNITQLTELYKQVDEAIEQTMKQIELVQQGIDQFENMVQNTITLPDQIRSKFQGTFKKLANLTEVLNVQRGDASALSQVFKATYSSASSIRDLASTGKDGIEAAKGLYSSMREKWSEAVDDSHEAAFQESGRQLDELQQQASELDSQLDDLLQTPEGQMQAIESSNQIAALQLQEAQRLRSLLAVSVQAQTQKAMKDEKAEQIADEAWKKALSTEKLNGFTARTEF
jgi:P-type conjugative transfer protein TrbJ